jgi:glyoxylase-like metal-dependent hydrolase (beta-lactamase superfamily II)
MRVRVLGCSGGIGAGLRTTSFLIDDDLLIDAGTGVGDLPLSELKRIRTVLVTHSHLDHTGGLPLLVDTIFETLDAGAALQVHARAETVDALRKHLFNWITWPDFTEIPNKEKPVLTLHEFAPGETRRFGARTVTSVPVAHTVPAVAYVVEQGGKVFAFSGDTSENDTLWEALNALPRLDALVVESAFSNSNREIARLSKHYCPDTLKADLAKLRHRVPIWITHLKPGGEETIMEELRALMPDRSLKRLDSGTEIEI